MHGIRDPEEDLRGVYLGLFFLASFLLLSIKYVRHLMAIWCRCFISVLTSVLGIFSFSSSLIGGSRRAPLTLVVMVMRGLTASQLF